MADIRLSLIFIMTPNRTLVLKCFEMLICSSRQMNIVSVSNIELHMTLVPFLDNWNWTRYSVPLRSAFSHPRRYDRDGHDTLKKHTSRP